jgi:hypothetical protein
LILRSWCDAPADLNEANTPAARFLARCRPAAQQQTNARFRPIADVAGSIVWVGKLSH